MVCKCYGDVEENSITQFRYDTYIYSTEWKILHEEGKINKRQSMRTKQWMCASVQMFVYAYWNRPRPLFCSSHSSVVYVVGPYFIHRMNMDIVSCEMWIKTEICNTAHAYIFNASSAYTSHLFVALVVRQNIFIYINCNKVEKFLCMLMKG